MYNNSSRKRKIFQIATLVLITGLVLEIVQATCPRKQRLARQMQQLQQREQIQKLAQQSGGPNQSGGGGGGNFDRIYNEGAPLTQISLKDYYSCPNLEINIANNSDRSGNGAGGSGNGAGGSSSGGAVDSDSSLSKQSLQPPQDTQSNQKGTPQCKVFGSHLQELDKSFLSKCNTTLIKPEIFRIPDTMKGPHVIMLFSGTRKYFPKFIVCKLNKQSDKYEEINDNGNGKYDFNPGESYCIEVGRRNFHQTETYTPEERGKYYLLVSDTLNTWAELAKDAQFSANVKLKGGGIGNCTFKLQPEAELIIKADGKTENIGYCASGLTVCYQRDKKSFLFYFSNGTYKSSGSNLVRTDVKILPGGSPDQPGSGAQIEKEKFEIECKSDIFKPLIEILEKNPMG